MAPIPEEVLTKVGAKKRAQERPTTSIQLKRHLDETVRLVGGLEGKNRRRGRNASIRGGELSAENQQLEAKLQDFNISRREIRAELAAMRASLSKARLQNAVSDLSRLESQIDERFRRLDALASSVRNASSQSDRGRALENLARFLRETNRSAEPNEEGRGPGPTFRRREIGPLKIDQPSKSKPAYLAYVESEKSSRYAWLGEVLEFVVAPASAMPMPVPTEAQSCGYSSADLAGDGQEVQITDEIRDLAKKLNYSPARIYEYVANEIRFEPYYGSLKGAIGTLYSKAGGATDQSSLLISLLRASNIPARYVRGQIRVVDSENLGAQGRAARWVGATTNYGAAVALAVNDNPGAQAIEEWGASGIALSHVWVEACVAYGNYRGSRQDQSGHRWVPIDASFKNNKFLQFARATTPFDYAAYMARRSHFLPDEALEQQLQQQLGTGSLESLGYKSELQPQKIDVLPVSLPYDVVAFTNWSNSGTPETAVLPDTHRYFLNIQIQNSSGATLVAPVYLPIPQTVLRRITLSFRGATANDENALAAWRNNGNPVSTLSCGINAVPVIKIEGVDRVVGTSSVGICTKNNRLSLTVSMAEARGGSMINIAAYENIGAANYHALQAYAFQASDRLLTERAASLMNAVRSTSVPNASLDAIEGEYLHLVGLKYMRYITDGMKRIGQLYGESGDSGTHIGLTSSNSKVRYIFDLPYAVDASGFFIDVPAGQWRSADLQMGTFSPAAFHLSGYLSSAYESYVWQENARLDAVSSVRGLQFAAETGMQVLTLTSANASGQLALLTSNADSSLNYAPIQVAEIQWLLSQGATVTLPRSQIRYENWTGSVWIAVADSFAAFTIGGAFGGGYTVGQPATVSYNPTTNTGYSFLTPPVYTPALDLLTVAPPTINSQQGLGVTANTVYYGDPVNVVNGNMFHIERDLSLRGRGTLPLVFERTYNSRDAQDGPLGFGWTHSLNQYLIFEDGNTDGQTTSSDSDGVTSSVTWVDGSGSRKFIGVTGTSGGVSIGSVFISPSGSHFTVTREADGTYRIREKNGLTYAFESIAGTSTQRARLIWIGDRNQNRLTLSYSGSRLSSAADALGRGITFEYSAANRITAIVDFTGRRHEYRYDSRGDLVQYLNPLALAGQQNPASYEYYTSSDGAVLNHVMRRFTRPKGNWITFEYYANGRVFRHYNNLGHTVTFSYNDYRRETVTTSERGFKRRYFFDQNGNTTRIIDEAGNTQTFTFDTNNPFNRTEETNSLGQRVQYAYDGAGNVTRVTTPSGNYIEFSYYNAFGQAGKVRDANGNFTLLRHDAAGNLLDRIVLRSGVGSGIDPSTYVPQPADILAWTVNTYNSVGNLLTTKRVRDFSSGVGPTVEYAYDANNLHVTSVTRCGDRNDDAVISRPSECDTSSPVYDSLGRMRSGVNASWYAVDYEYDALDRITRGTDRAGKLRDYSYDANGNPTGEQLVLVNGGVRNKVDESVSTFDQADRLATVRNAGGFVTSYEYDAAGNVLKVTNPDRYSIGFEYDRLNRVVAAFDEEGHRASRALDPGGKLLTLTDPNGNTVKRHEYYGNERDGRLRRVYDALGRYSELDYDANGNVVRVSDNIDRVTRTDYDALGRPTRIVGPLLSATNTRPVTRYYYDSLSNRTRIDAGSTDASGTNPSSDVLAVQATYAYDDFGRKLRETDALSRSWQFTYDRHGNVETITDARNLLTQYTYGYGGKVLTQVADDNGTTTYVYDGVGRVTNIASPDVSYSYQYDAAHRVRRVTDSRGGGKSLFYSYSPGGWLNKVEDSEGRRTDYLYDPVGRLSGIWASNEDKISFVYDPGGRLTQKSFANGASTRYQYNADNTLARVVNAIGSSGISEHIYTYDQASRRETSTDTIGPATVRSRYVYDELARLSEVRDGTSDVLIEGYTYDIFGNRRSRSTALGTDSYVYDSAHQLQSIRQGSDTGTVLASFNYDSNGNITQKAAGEATTTLLYDALNRVREVSRTGLATQVYRYDHENRRVQKSIGTEVAHYFYNGPDIAAEYGSDWSTPRAIYAHGPQWDDPLVRTAAGASIYYHRDGINSVVAVSDAAGTISASARYDAWGSRTSHSGAIPQYGYTGREPDETGLIYYRARYYDSTIGRFAQVDPAGFVDGINRYAYALNSPTNYVDPRGLMVSSPMEGSSNSTYYSSVDAERPAGVGSMTALAGPAASLIIGGGYEISAGVLMTQEPFDLGFYLSTGSGIGIDVGAQALTFGGYSGDVFDVIGTTINHNVSVGPVSTTWMTSDGHVDSISDFNGITMGAGPGLPAGYSVTESETRAVSYRTLIRWATDLMCRASGDC